MKNSALFFYLFLLLLVSSCLSRTYDVQAVCEVTDLYNYIVKWEVTPVINGKVSIYTSTDPDHFDMQTPVAVVPASLGCAKIIMNGSLNRRYFQLVFNHDVKTIVGVRAQKFSTIQNFRDIGGYKTTDGRHIRWGQIYRSGNLDSLSDLSAKRINLMNIKSLIDLRMPSSSKRPSPNVDIPNCYQYPVFPYKEDPVPLIKECRFKRGDADVFMQDVFGEMVLRNKDSFRLLFQLLRNEDNYPLVIESDYGTLQTSIASALILSTLGVPDQTVIEDYLLSNKYYNKYKVARIARTLPYESQEALSVITKSDESYLLSALNQILQHYGSLNSFMEEEIGIDADFRHDIQNILLR